LRRKKEEILALLNEFVNSGTSRRQWCLDHDISASSLYTWLQRYGAADIEKKVNFIPVKVDATHTVKKPSTYNNHIINDILYLR
jgi:transposase-like protein